MRREMTAGLMAWVCVSMALGGDLSYPIVDTGQTKCYDDKHALKSAPSAGQPFYGQDAQQAGHQPSYADNGDGTITDRVTGLMWAKAPVGKLSWDDAVKQAAASRLAGHDDWRMPTIKELYSLILFTGVEGRAERESRPFIDTDYFEFHYGDMARGERFIDCQYWSSTKYTSRTMRSSATVFGVNFADGRIKGYPQIRPGRGKRVPHEMYALFVRGNPRYGRNDFVDNGDGTITDRATGLMWSKADSGKGMNWQDALAWVQARNAEHYLGHDDWRMPNAKELQSIVDYTRSPHATKSAAIDPIFQITAIKPDPASERAGDWPYFWTSTTHLSGPPRRQGSTAVYIAFGEACGWMPSPPGSRNYRLMDVHGAGAQRSDPKRGDAKDYPHGHGPQGDVIRIENFVRLVRDSRE